MESQLSIYIDDLEVPIVQSVNHANPDGLQAVLEYIGNTGYMDEERKLFFPAHRIHKIGWRLAQ